MLLKIYFLPSKNFLLTNLDPEKTIFPQSVLAVLTVNLLLDPRVIFSPPDTTLVNTAVTLRSVHCLSESACQKAENKTQAMMKWCSPRQTTSVMFSFPIWKMEKSFFLWKNCWHFAVETNQNLTQIYEFFVVFLSPHCKFQHLHPKMSSRLSATDYWHIILHRSTGADFSDPW